jgi:SRSO17 transposase
MNRREIARLDRELDHYIESMVAGLGRIERRLALIGYLTGLLLDGERKSVEPMAARLVESADKVQAMRQRLQQAVCVAEWSDAEVYRRIAVKIERELPGIEAFVFDDTGLPKKGEFSVGVKRQYSGTLGRIDNCQVAVSLHLAADKSSACIGMRLFLPEDWAADEARRKMCGVPAAVDYKPKWKIALDLLDDALAWGVRKHVVLADAGYGDIGAFREGLDERGLTYVVRVNGQPVVWQPESRPTLKPAAKSKNGKTYQDEQYPPLPVAEMAKRLSYRKVTWREGSRGWQSSRFAAVRIRCAHAVSNGCPPGQEQWLLCEWPDGEEAPNRFWLSTLPADASVRTLVRLGKLRWRVERDYQEMKQELGLDHFEGRTWRGLHHHFSLCAVAHAFLALRRALFPPNADVDAADGASPPSAGAAQSYRLVSTL